ncbi:hypothetical protein RchiOBHm_Chr7g0233251 [Rosa chinensis]|uniref:GRDP C2 domain-containing protein n=1 Tax=Rosa chinensis TaxID=74649 RepID=A0A2P6PG44_ROSCH|nr:hypothetical protein RchiOBHm_Chr7g0233251 [Rosa chinensis]
MLVEVMLEVVAVRNLPTKHKGSLFVSLSKKQPDFFFSTRRTIEISSDSEEKEVSVFQSQPTGELLFELMSHSSSILPISKSPILLGTSEITLDNLVNPLSTLQVKKWLELMPNSGVLVLNPISLCIALSWTTPIPSLYILHIPSRSLVSFHSLEGFKMLNTGHA